MRRTFGSLDVLMPTSSGTGGGVVIGTAYPFSPSYKSPLDPSLI